MCWLRAPRRSTVICAVLLSNLKGREKADVVVPKTLTFDSFSHFSFFFSSIAAGKLPNQGFIFKQGKGGRNLQGNMIRRTVRGLVRGRPTVNQDDVKCWAAVAALCSLSTCQ